MKNKTFILLLLTILTSVSLVFSGCQKRYWYRQKINFFSTRPKTKAKFSTVHIEIKNFTPAVIPEYLENGIRQFVSYRLYKHGYLETSADTTADFNFTVIMFVDSFHTKGTRSQYYSTSVNEFYRDRRGRHLSVYDSEQDVKQLTIKYDLKERKYKRHLWDFMNELYYFNEETKDLRRSKSMIRYSINNAPPGKGG